MLVDVGDNIGGGTPGDGTVLLAELLAQDAQEASIVIADPEAAEAAFAAGVGGMVRSSRSAARRTAGMAIRSRSRGASACSAMDSGYTRVPRTPVCPVDMGPTAVLRCGGVNLVLTSHKCMPGDQQQLKSVGIDPTRQQIIVVKAAVRWRGGYRPDREARRLCRHARSGQCRPAPLPLPAHPSPDLPPGPRNSVHGLTRSRTFESDECSRTTSARSARSIFLDQYQCDQSRMRDCDLGRLWGSLRIATVACVTGSRSPCAR